MKKSFLLLTLCAAALGFTSCSDDKDTDEVNVLETPMLAAPAVTHNSATFTWKAVDNADMYVYTLNGGSEMQTTEPTVTLTGLTPSTEYSFSIKARKDNSKYFKDSDYATYNFTTNAEPVAAKTYRVASFGDDWDTWFYTYNENGTPKRIYRTADGTPGGALDREWVFTYDGKNLAVTGKNEWTITLNDKNLVETLVDGEKTYAYTYDADGYLTQVTKNGEVAVNIVVENGDIMRWSKMKDGAEVWKLHTYDVVENVSGCRATTAEGIGASRWLVESGLFGKGSAHLHTEIKWDYSETGSTYTFDLDANGCVIGEHKLYGSDLENFHYTYE